MSSDLFAGTAGYYARYRPAYPDAFLEELLERAGSRRRSLLDLGCGTGEIAIPLSRVFDDVLAVDVDPDMVAQAEQKARDERVANVTWMVSRAEDVQFPAPCDLITAGASFHWMDREALAPRCYGALADDGAIAILGTNSTPWEATEEWHEVVISVIRASLGDQRRAGGSTYAVQKKHEDYLEPAGFRLQEFEHAVEHRWTIDEYLGFLYSTSFAGVHVLGDKKEAFEQDMRRALAGVAPDGVFTETLRFYAILGHKS